MTYDEAMLVCEDRIKFCANIYGNKWKDEMPFLMACRDALEVAIKFVDGFLTDEEKAYLTDTFEIHYMKTLSAIAQNDKTAESVFEKLGMIESIDEIARNISRTIE